MVGGETSFGTIRNNTALKLREWYNSHWRGFGTIRNNTALKLKIQPFQNWRSFGTIRNNTALKLDMILRIRCISFGTIRNNTALKHRAAKYQQLIRFWNHSKQHSSKTCGRFFVAKNKVLEPFETTQL